jgi:hypothetical protein
MDSYVEQYPAKQGGITLHTWTNMQGRKKDNFYITGISGAPVAAWFRAVLRTKRLADIAVFPASPTDVYA